MPSITINGKKLEFKPGQSILEVALNSGEEIPHYCWHPGLSVVASCRICLGEVWAPNPRNNNALEPMPKLVPTCQTPCGDGQVVYTNSPKAIANQKSVMELLLINHPVDCPVCDQAGECHLQDYSYQYGRGVSRFQEEKIKQPKKDLGPKVLLYSDRCIMCTRCVRFTREVTGTSELLVEKRGAMEQIDVFPGQALDNELAGNVVDLCPVGALLDKEFLFEQRVWFMTKTPSIDGITASGDNIFIEHSQGVIRRIKPRANMAVNRWWITDEVRHGWQFVHGENRLRMPVIKAAVRNGEPAPDDAPALYELAYRQANRRLGKAARIGAMISPMLSCEDAYLLAKWVLSHDAQAVLAVGPVPMNGQDKVMKDGFRICAEKAPNARGVRRVLKALAGNRPVLECDAFIDALKKSGSAGGGGGIDAVVLTGNYPSEWVTPALAGAVEAAQQRGGFALLIDTLPNALVPRVDIVLPGATWVEKAGTFENHASRLQTFERAIEPLDFCKSESQLALDLMADLAGDDPIEAGQELTARESSGWSPLTAMAEQAVATPSAVVEAAATKRERRGSASTHGASSASVAPTTVAGVRVYNAAAVRREMGALPGLGEFASSVHAPEHVEPVESDMQYVEL